MSTNHQTRTVMTSTVAEWASLDPHRYAWITECLQRHQRDDWGDLDPDDHQADADTRRHGTGRIRSSYRTPAALHADDPPWCQFDRLWIITDDIEDPDCFTTILPPSDY